MSRRRSPLALLGVEQHRARETVLDAATGIEELALGVECHTFRLKAQRHQRRVAAKRKHRAGAGLLGELVAHFQFKITLPDCPVFIAAKPCSNSVK